MQCGTPGKAVAVVHAERLLASPQAQMRRCLEKACLAQPVQRADGCWLGSRTASAGGDRERQRRSATPTAGAASAAAARLEEAQHGAWAGWKGTLGAALWGCGWKLGRLEAMGPSLWRSPCQRECQAAADFQAQVSQGDDIRWPGGRGADGAGGRAPMCVVHLLPSHLLPCFCDCSCRKVVLEPTSV